MRESGSYPAGCEHDPAAPWNQVDIETIPCSECGSTGEIFIAPCGCRVNGEFGECQEHGEVNDGVADPCESCKEVTYKYSQLCKM